MPVPFETLIPYAIIIAMFGVSGASLSKLRNMQNGGKRQRRGIDQWDRWAWEMRLEAGVADNFPVMDRDRRLTGLLRGQTDTPKAPPGFELNNPWRLENRYS